MGARLDYSEIIAATRGRILVDCPPDAPTGFSIDSRTMKEGDLFFAIRGPQHDGHRFANAALAAGAAGVVVSDASCLADGGTNKDAAVVLVEDTTRALQDLAASVRERRQICVGAITGSVGKTTTKELVALFLSGEKSVHASPGNLNNHYGLPLALLGLPDDVDHCVLEMGISTPGEMDRLIEIARPDFGLVTLIAAAHAGNFRSLEQLADEKMKLPEGSRCALLNGDDPLQAARESELPGDVRWFAAGGAREAWVSLVHQEAKGLAGVHLTLEHRGQRFEVECPLMGKHQARNILAAAALALSMGASPDSLARQARLARPGAHRGEIHRCSGGVTLIDESYNSNPRAMQAAMDLLANTPSEGRRLLVVGDMLELGAESSDEHRRIGRLAAEHGVDLLLGVGAACRDLVTAAAEAGVAAEHRADADEASEWLADAMQPGDVVLIKGSRGIGLDRVVSDAVEAEAVQ